MLSIAFAAAALVFVPAGVLMDRWLQRVEEDAKDARARAERAEHRAAAAEARANDALRIVRPSSFPGTEDV